MSDGPIRFDPFCLDPAEARLSRAGQPVPLTPKAFDVLLYLARRPGRLVTKDELLNAVWADSLVGDASLKVSIAEIRKALRDDPTKPQYVETVHRRGYRFVGAVGDVAGKAAAPAAPTFVGRGDELAWLGERLDRAGRGERQVVFVTGEPGSGKTALAETFVRSLGRTGRAACGQCFEQFGAGEAYMPVLEALGQFRADGRLVDAFRRHAPAWAALVPWLGGGEGGPAAPTSERLLREMADALEFLAAPAPLVLVLEDLHWADPSTIDLVTALARRRQPARLLVLGTYRPAEIGGDHPLRAAAHELLARRLCADLSVTPLSAAAVGEFLAARFPGPPLPAALAGLLRDRTEGNPLFVAALADDLEARGVIAPAPGGGWRLTADLTAVAVGVPDRLRPVIDRQIDRLAEADRGLLEAASAAGVEFSAAAAAAALADELVAVEDRCERLARGGLFLQSRGATEWPDGTAASRYRFAHELYHRVFAQRVPAARRRLFQRRVGERLVAAYPGREAEVAAELAAHFREAGDPARAVHFLALSAQNAARVAGHAEAIDLARRGLDLLGGLPPSEGRDRAELGLQLTLGLQLQIGRGYAAPEVEGALGRARDLCRAAGDNPHLFPVAYGLWMWANVRADYASCRELVDQLFILAGGDTALTVPAHQAQELTLLFHGDPAGAAEHCRRAAAADDPDRTRDLIALCGHDPAGAALGFGAAAEWLLGFPDRAADMGREAVARARRLSHPPSLALTLWAAAWVRSLRREPAAALTLADEAITVSTGHGFAFWEANARVVRGWALAALGRGDDGLAELRRGEARWLELGAGVERTHQLGLLAEVLAGLGRTDEALAAIADGLANAERTGDRYYVPELYRLRGEIGSDKDCFRTALDAAGDRQSLRLRAAASLHRLHRQQGRPEASAGLLAEVYGGFTEGLDTPDLTDARNLLADPQP
jgi:DNA-binding winged helix-turn-helix (wHTH) protein/predicted ATPase